MTTDMINRVARSIYEASPRNKPYSLLTVSEREKLLREARAAIEAMLEPTAEMVIAGGGRSLGCDFTWRAMIRETIRQDLSPEPKQ